MPHDDELTPDELTAVPAEGADAVEPVKPVEAPPAPVVPAGVSRDEFMEFQRQQSQQMSQLIATLRPQPQAVVEDLPSDEELDRGILAGSAAGSVRKLVEGTIRRELGRFNSEVVDPLRTVGLGTMETLSREVVSKTLPYYADFKTEIDAALANLPAHQRSNPDAIRAAHNLVAGQNAEKIAAKAVEAALRKSRQDPDAVGAAPGGRGRAGGGRAQPEVADVFGEGAAAALRSSGRDLDSFARRLGYKDGAEYLRLAQEGNS